MSNFAVGFSSSKNDLDCNTAPTQHASDSSGSLAHVLLDTAISITAMRVRRSGSLIETDEAIAELAQLHQQRTPNFSAHGSPSRR